MWWCHCHICSLPAFTFTQPGRGVGSKSESSNVPTHPSTLWIKRGANTAAPRSMSHSPNMNSVRNFKGKGRPSAFSVGKRGIRKSAGLAVVSSCDLNRKWDPEHHLSTSLFLKLCIHKRKWHFDGKMSQLCFSSIYHFLSKQGQRQGFE